MVPTPLKMVNINELSKCFCSRTVTCHIAPNQSALHSSHLGASIDVPTMIIGLILTDLGGPEGWNSSKIPQIPSIFKATDLQGITEYPRIVKMLLFTHRNVSHWSKSKCVVFLTSWGIEWRANCHHRTHIDWPERTGRVKSLGHG